MIRFPTNGIRGKLSAVNRSRDSEIRNETEELSAVTYDNLGNYFTRYFLSGLVPDENVKRMVFKINMRNH